jgi:hypothetical protein
MALGLRRYCGILAWVRQGWVAVPLVSFNLGVELGQVGIMLVVLPLIWKLRSQPFFVMRCVPACSLMVTVVGGYWLLREHYSAQARARAQPGEGSSSRGHLTMAHCNLTGVVALLGEELPQSSLWLLPDCPECCLLDRVPD